MAGQDDRAPRRRAAHFTRKSTDVPSSNEQDTGAGKAVGVKPAMGGTTNSVSQRSAEVTKRARGGRSHTRHSDGTQNRRLSVVLVVLAIALAFGVVFFVFILPSLTNDSSSGNSGIAAGQQVEVSIADGSTTSSIAQTLYEAGVISDTSAFIQRVQERGVESQLKSGAYTLVTGSDADNVIDQLIAGSNSTSGVITIPEGYTVSQIASLVEETFDIPADEFLAQATASNYVDDYSFLSEAQNDSLEGFLFPKTYNFSGQDVTSDLIIRTMLDQYETEISSLNLDEARTQIQQRYGIEVSDYDILIMASIVEREALTDDDRPLISSVFYNRLSQGMNLQSDATLAYTLKREVTSADLEQDDPYNTYTRSGLTPTPICNPGLASLTAAANPSDTNYLFFYISGDVHAFSETYEQHQQVIAENAG